MSNKTPITKSEAEESANAADSCVFQQPKTTEKASIGDEHKLMINDTQILLKKDETILEALERNNIDAQFNCREGFCGVCRTKLIAGALEYTIDPLAFIDDDEILSCCTVAKSDIEIKLD